MSRFDWIPIHPEGKEWVMWDHDRQTFLASVSIYSYLVKQPAVSNVLGDMGRHSSLCDAGMACQWRAVVCKGTL